MRDHRIAVVLWVVVVCTEESCSSVQWKCRIMTFEVIVYPSLPPLVRLTIFLTTTLLRSTIL